MAIMTITAPTPMMMPSIDKKERALLLRMALMAILMRLVKLIRVAFFPTGKPTGTVSLFCSGVIVFGGRVFVFDGATFPNVGLIVLGCREGSEGLGGTEDVGVLHVLTYLTVAEDDVA